MPFCSSFKLKINFEKTGVVLWSVQSSLEIKWPPDSTSQASPSVTLKLQPQAVLCAMRHRDTGSHHGLGKYWHFGLCEVSLTLCTQAKGKKKKKERRRGGEVREGKGGQGRGRSGGLKKAFSVLKSQNEG